MVIYLKLLATPAGDLLLGEYEEALCLCDWISRRNRQAYDARLLKRFKADFEPRNTPLLKLASDELMAYFDSKRQRFDIPLALAGTDFQHHVWQALQQIPYGEVTYYQQIAVDIGKPKAIRAVANAIGANPVSIMVPCHRVLGKNKQLTGYAGGIGAKRTLLNLEHNTLNNHKTASLDEQK